MKDSKSPYMINHESTIEQNKLNAKKKLQPFKLLYFVPNKDINNQIMIHGSFIRENRSFFK